MPEFCNKKEMKYSNKSAYSGSLWLERVISCPQNKEIRDLNVSLKGLKCVNICLDISNMSKYVTHKALDMGIKMPSIWADLLKATNYYRIRQEIERLIYILNFLKNKSTTPLVDGILISSAIKWKTCPSYDPLWEIVRL